MSEVKHASHPETTVSDVREDCAAAREKYAYSEFAFTWVTVQFLLDNISAQSERIARLEEALRTCLTELEELNKGIGWRDGEWHAVTVARKALEQQ